MEYLPELVTALLAFAAAIVTATGAVRLDRFFQEVDRRRDLYLEVLAFIDNIAILVKEQVIAGTATSNSSMVELERLIMTQKTKLDLIASKKVRTAMQAYREAMPRLTKALKSPSTPGASTDFRDRLQHGLKVIQPERDALAEAMRTDLRQRPWQRRKA